MQPSLLDDDIHDTKVDVETGWVVVVYWYKVQEGEKTGTGDTEEGG